MPWVSWLEYLDEEFQAIISFFADIVALIPSPLIQILFLFPALTIVFWIVRYFHDVVG